MALAVSRGEGGGAGGEDNHDEVANTVVFQPRIQQVFGPGTSKGCTKKSGLASELTTRVVEELE